MAHWSSRNETKNANQAVVSNTLASFEGIFGKTPDLATFVTFKSILKIANHGLVHA
jgi:hypothetical protein